MVQDWKKGSSKKAVLIEPAINVYYREEFVGRVKLLKDVASMIQFDLIDGRFAEPKNFADPIIVSKLLKPEQIHLHIMSFNPDEELQKWESVQAKKITVHVEIEKKKLRNFLVSQKEKGRNVGVAIGAQTPLEDLRPFLKNADRVLFVSVHPGAGGQEFNKNTYKRVNAFHLAFPEIEIGVDGGVKKENIKPLLECGVNSITIGSAIFHGNARDNLKMFQEELI